jgi:translation initiation factor 1
MSNNDWKKRLGGIVFSTDPAYPYQEENTSEAENVPPAKQQLKIYRDKKQRAGKEVTIVEGFIGSSADMDTLGKLLKTKCGAGGSVKDGLIIVQGDFRQKIKAVLDKEGYPSKII